MRLSVARLARRTFVNSAGNRSGGVTPRIFAAGVTSAALAGYGIGIYGPALLPPEEGKVSERLSTRRRQAAESGGTRHSMMQVTTREELMDAFELVGPLEHGGTATVWRAVERNTGKTVAIKVVDKSLVGTTLIAKEIDAMQRCAGDPNVAGLLAVYDVDGDDLNPSGEWRLVLELAEGGEVLNWVQQHPKYSERVAAGLTNQLASPVRRLHSLWMVHRDIKPENLCMMSKDEHALLKLVDFGAAALIEAPGACVEGKAGTWTYWAPEQAARLPHGTRIASGRRTDATRRPWRALQGGTYACGDTP